MSIIYTTNYNLIKRSYLDTLWHTSVNSNMDTIDLAMHNLQLAVDLKLDASQRGVANGVASLDGSILVPVAQIPALPISKTTNLQTTLDAKVANPATTVGDLLYASTTASPSAIARLGIGSAGQILTVAAGLPSWATASWQANVVTTKGDLVVGDNSGVAARLGIGSSGYVLTVASGTASWQPVPSNLNSSVSPSNLASTAAIGTSIYAALADHVHSYTGLVTNPMTTVGDLIYGGASGTPTKLTVGTIGHVLTVSGGGVPVWSPVNAATVTASVTPLDLAAAAAIGSSAEAARADHVHSFSSITSILGALSYKGTWNANTNVPVIPAASSSNKGYYYVVATAGSTSVSGITDWKVGDWLVSNGSTWDKIDNTDSPIFTDTVTFPAGTTTLAPAKFQAGSKLTSAVAHAIEWDGSRLYVTDSTPVRHKVTYSDDPDMWNLYAGVVTQPLYNSLGTGHLYVGNTGVYNFLPNADGSGTPAQFTGVTGFTGVTMTDGATNYVYADYNGGSPLITFTTDKTVINRTTKIPILGVYRAGNTLHTWNYDSMGIGLANKLNDALVRTRSLVWETGLTLGESGTRNITITSGTVWRGGTPYSVTSYSSGTNNALLCYHSSGNWTTSSIATYNNTQYDNGTDLVTLSDGRYAVNFIYRGIEDDANDTYYVLAKGDYILSDAMAAQPPVDLPELITSHAILVGRIIVLKGINTATRIDSAYGQAAISVTPVSTAPIWVGTADVGPIANTTTPTSLLGTGSGNLTLPVNFLTVGKRIIFKLSGTFRDNNSTPTFTIDIKLGSTSVCTVTGSLTTLTAVTQWTFDADLICRTSGSTGTVKTHGRFNYSDGSTQTLLRDISTTTTTINTTTTQAIDVIQTWGTANANNTITCDISVIEGNY